MDNNKRVVNWSFSLSSLGYCVVLTPAHVVLELFALKWRYWMGRCLISHIGPLKKNFSVKNLYFSKLDIAYFLL